MRFRSVAAFVAALAVTAPVLAADFGRTPGPEEIELWDIDVKPDGTGLRPGSGTVALGATVYETYCLACHGPEGQNGIKDRLVGGQGSLTSDKPIKTVGSFWPYATTLWDYIHRAMPYQLPGMLSIDDTYSVTAYILSLNGILPSDAALDQTTLPQVRMPNRDGFVPEPEFIHIKHSGW
jgi:S-disulfanyl-L-cysteine oxidoreductase SoxD